MIKVTNVQRQRSCLSSLFRGMGWGRGNSEAPILGEGFLVGVHVVVPRQNSIHLYFQQLRLSFYRTKFSRSNDRLCQTENRSNFLPEIVADNVSCQGSSSWRVVIRRASCESATRTHTPAFISRFMAAVSRKKGSASASRYSSRFHFNPQVTNIPAAVLTRGCIRCRWNWSAIG